MNENNPSSAPTNAAAPAEDDPRFAFAKVVNEVGALIEHVTPEMLGNPTPCPDFTVKDLLEHCVMVISRVAAIGRGEHWSTIDQVAVDAGWHDDFVAGAHATMEAWTDPSVLDKVLEVPWGAFPGSALIYTYTAELATHGWDLSQATGLDFAIDDDLLHGALFAIQMVPAEGRDHPDVPFSEVVDPGPDAPVLLKLAGWAGRNVAA